MKMEKMDKKQLPQVIALGVLSLALLGYAGSRLLGSRASRQAKAAEKPQPAASQVAQAGVQPGEPLPDVPGVTLPPLYNPDPFAGRRRAVAINKSQPEGEDEPEPYAPKNQPEPPPGYPMGPGGLLPALGLLPSPLGGDDVPTRPTGPQRPQLKLTGVIDGSPDMALVELADNERRLLQVGDVLPSQYRVERIQLQGITLHSQAGDRWFVPVGYDSEAPARKLQRQP